MNSKGDEKVKKHWMPALRRAVFGASLACVLGQAPLAQAQSDFPSHTMSIVVPFSTGGSTDLVARIEAKALGMALNQSIVVENRTGGGGVIGWGYVARAKPDGYTLLTTEMSFAIAASLIPNLPFNPHKDFQQVTTLISVPHVLVVNANVPAKNLKELTALLKSQPGKLFFGSGGVGTNTHLGGELFNSLAGVKMSHVPFRGAGAAMQGLMSDQVQVMVTSLPTVLEQIKSGKLRALMMASDVRSPSLPDVPSANELGLPGMNMQFWVGFSVPAGTPPALVQRLNHAMVQTLDTPEMKTRLKDLGMQAVGNTSEQAEKLVRDEIVRWAAVIKNADIKPE
jgi:tripartite-type tricarboxylate transporter receptor subunit TctC